MNIKRNCLTGESKLPDDSYVTSSMTRVGISSNRQMNEISKHAFENVLKQFHVLIS